MKTHRLLSIVLYLLNHDIASAATLAEKFEVSKRTIFRDIEQLSLAGIPIRSATGVNGGYSIMDGYKLDGRLVSAGDQISMVTALKGFLTAYDGNRYHELLDKIATVFPKEQQQTIFYDFGASGEDHEIQGKIEALEKTIRDKIPVQIAYVNASGEATSRLIEPIALSYRWHAWYLLAFCTSKQDYRIFKLARICELTPAEIKFSKGHGDPTTLLEHAFQGSGRKELEITLLCKAAIKVQVREYLGGTIEKTHDNGDFILRFTALEDERIWFATLLSFGDRITVLEPEEVKNRLAETAEQILSVYRKQ